MNAPPRPARTTVVLLAGGDASRLPGKLALPVGGEPMLVRVYRRVSGGGRQCVVSARAALDGALAEAIPAPVLLDEFPHSGPLGALVSAAARVATPLLFAAAGDLPGLDAHFIDALEREYDRAASEGEPPDAVIPVWPDGKAEPLAALYDARALREHGRRALQADLRKMTAALDGMRVRTFAVRPEDEARLANVNTPADYEPFRA